MSLFMTLGWNSLGGWGGFGVLWRKNVAWCVIRPQRYTYEFVERADSFTLSFFQERYRSALELCGSKSGRDTDKFKAGGLTAVPAKSVEPPLIEECAGHLECQVVETFRMETHDLLICQVVRACARPELFDGRWIPEKFHTLHYLAGNRYGLLQRTVVAKTRT
jgi:flavin reductase (DIM6/NTAB) family NADH-FMN oxidoreductase RutF